MVRAVWDTFAMCSPFVIQHEEIDRTGNSQGSPRRNYLAVQFRRTRGERGGNSAFSIRGVALRAFFDYLNDLPADAGRIMRRG